MLKAYSVFDIEIGYVQGMNYIAALLLIYIYEEEQANQYVESSFSSWRLIPSDVCWLIVFTRLSSLNILFFTLLLWKINVH